MGKKQRNSKKIKIPKNRDIEEIVEQAEKEEKIESMEQVTAKIDEQSLVEKKKQEFKKSLEVPDETVNVSDDDKKIEIRVKNYSARRDAQIADHERIIAYLKAMNKIEEINDDNEIEIQEFFNDIQRKTDEYLKMQYEKEKLEER